MRGNASTITAVRITKVQLWIVCRNARNQMSTSAAMPTNSTGLVLRISGPNCCERIAQETARVAAESDTDQRR